jgi:hypothetical protein
MRFVHFVFFNTAHADCRISRGDEARIRSIVCATPGLERALLHTPARARDHYTDDGPPPQLALQLYYPDLETLEEALSPAGYLQQLALEGDWRSLPSLKVTHQVMYARPFPVINAVHRPDPGEPACSYLVHYAGEAEDFNAWLGYYLDHHPQIMKTFPRVREIEIYTRVDWRDSMPWQRVDHMQRNRLVFDSAAAVEAAMNSPVRHAMRADFKRFPPFTGANPHFPMHTETLFVRERTESA